ncbi:uncharacterized protein E0L32_003682 [Thyridium curvatum]|uniref:Uncharacterized protein n=1 Tax=Thyridium curvatum TaxID=1093900 RepID=A0A507BIC6_9PEZI|nr:uncharacterized protein E0L32_003682 [Thyridium curvatum]TPX16741.1 hypothetical protein E0L32_003682 [Thyridium curvatum]
MDSVSAYSFASCGWLSLQALPLVIWPSFVTSLLTPEHQHADGGQTALQEYLARSLGLSQLGLGLLIVVLSGALPLTSVVESPQDSISPYANAVVLVSSLYHFGIAFYGYVKYNETDLTGFILGAIGSGVLAAFGVWCMLFGDSRKISKRTGADKRTSGFPFKNSEADKRKDL